MPLLDQDTLQLYKLLAKHGSEWVKKRLCPREAAEFALKAHHGEVQEYVRSKVDPLPALTNWINPLKEK